MHAALTATGAASRLITIEDGPHGFERGVTLADLMASQPRAVGQACADAVDFLVSHLV